MSEKANAVRSERREMSLKETVTGITLNVAVKNIARSTEFLRRLGFDVDPMFAEAEDMELIRLSDTVYVMLNTESRFEGISRKRSIDTSTNAEVIFQLRVGSRKAVDDIVDAALALGAKAIHEPNDQGSLYGRSFEDLDGHNWDCFWVAMNPTNA